MNKKELIKNMAEKCGLTQKDCEAALNAFMKSIEEALVREEKVQLIGFGTFEVKHRKARKGRNPRNPEETIEIPAATVPAFKSGKSLKEAVNQG